MATIEIHVPDIGDFDEVTVIELMVKPGDTVRAEQSLSTVESDKASMEIPSSAAGVVKEVKVALGDKVKQGSLVLLLEAAADTAAAPVAAASAAPAAPSPVAAPVAESAKPAAATPPQAAAPIETPAEPTPLRPQQSAQTCHKAERRPCHARPQRHTSRCRIQRCNT